MVVEANIATQQTRPTTAKDCGRLECIKNSCGRDNIQIMTPQALVFLCCVFGIMLNFLPELYDILPRV